MNQRMYLTRQGASRQQLARTAPPMRLRTIPATDSIVALPCTATTALPTQSAGTTIHDPGQGSQALPGIQSSLQLIPLIHTQLIVPFANIPPPPAPLDHRCCTSFLSAPRDTTPISHRLRCICMINNNYYYS